MTAEELAHELHAGQVDQGGRPYVEHLADVAGILLRRWPDAPPFAIEAAWLHDALEDTATTPDTLLAAGVSPAAAAIVRRLTRPAGMTYRQWIADLAASGDAWAICVKLADNEHNCDPSRRRPGSDIVERRYVPARRVLEEALAQCRTDIPF